MIKNSNDGVNRCLQPCSSINYRWLGCLRIQLYCCRKENLFMHHPRRRNLLLLKSITAVKEQEESTRFFPMSVIPNTHQKCVWVRGTQERSFSTASCQEEVPTPPVTPTLVEREGTAQWQSICYSVPNHVQMEIQWKLMPSLTPSLERAGGSATIEKCLLSREKSARGRQSIFQEQTSPNSLAVTASHLWAGSQHAIILGSFPFRSMTPGESLTSAPALVRECKIYPKPSLLPFWLLSHAPHSPLTQRAEFLVTWAGIPTIKPLCTDRRANCFDHWATTTTNHFH